MAEVTPLPPHINECVCVCVFCVYYAVVIGAPTGVLVCVLLFLHILLLVLVEAYSNRGIDMCLARSVLFRRAFAGSHYLSCVGRVADVHECVHLELFLEGR